MWRVASTTLLIAACSSSPEERLADLEHDTQVLCLNTSCTPQPVVVPIATIVDCMNTALQDGRTAEAKWMGYDSHYNSQWTYVFATDHEVQEIDEHMDNFTGKPDYYAPPACKGPFKPGVLCGSFQSVPAWDGCP
jgi:hypothetical protein